ncbi:MAG: JAB domain-containing protein [Streptosporangiaceae bacterium]|jgi:DNA repair protein RadC
MAAIPPHERPRERLLAQGAEALTERELLALVLRNGTKGTSALGLAAGLLADYGSLGELAAARPEELAMRPGVGHAKAAALVAAFSLSRRLNAGMGERPVLQRPGDVARIAVRELRAARRERVLVLICDAGNRLRSTAIVSEGSVDQSLMPVREILNAVLRHDGRAFALAHNHPGGTAEASDADQRATTDLREAAKVVGVRFLGHVVVAGTEWSAVS